MPDRKGARHGSPEAAFITMALRGPEPCGSPALGELAAEVRDWDAVGAMSAAHGISPWLLRTVARAGIAGLIDRDVLSTMRRQAFASAMLSLALTEALEGALLSFEDAGIPVIVLKGPVVAEQYPGPELRPYRDLDLLVPLDRHAEVAAACARLGYEVIDDHGGVSAKTTSGHLFPFETVFAHRESGVLLDVHYDPLQLGLRPRDGDGMWRRCEPWTFQRTAAKRPALDDLVLLLTVHLHRHGFGRLIWCKDLDLILRRDGARLDWEWLAASARAEGVESSLTSMLRLLQRVLDTPLPDAAAVLTKGTYATLLYRLLWPDDQVLGLRPMRWRRAVQFVPKDGLRGALPSLVFMGRRGDKIKSLLRRPQ